MEGPQARMRVRRQKHMVLHRGGAAAMPGGPASAGAWTSCMMCRPTALPEVAARMGAP